MITLSSTSALAATEKKDCGPNLAPLSFAGIEEHWDQRRIRPELWAPGDEDLATFWYEGWPRIVKRAAARGLPVNDFVLEATRNLPAKDFSRSMEMFLVGLEDVDPARGLDQYLNRLLIETAYGGFRLLANLVIEAERRGLEHPTFDPFAPMDARWMEFLIERARTVDAIAGPGRKTTR